MEQQYLTIREFERWAKEDSDIKRRILDNTETLNAESADLRERVGHLEGAQSKVTTNAATWSAGISGAVTLIVQGVMAALGSKN